MSPQTQAMPEIDNVSGAACLDGVLWSRTVPAIPANRDDPAVVNVDVYRESESGSVSIFVGDYVQLTADAAVLAASALMAAARYVAQLRSPPTSS